MVPKSRSAIVAISPVLFPASWELAIAPLLLILLSIFFNYHSFLSEVLPHIRCTLFLSLLCPSTSSDFPLIIIKVYNQLLLLLVLCLWVSTFNPTSRGRCVCAALLAIFCCWRWRPWLQPSSAFLLDPINYSKKTFINLYATAWLHLHVRNWKYHY